MLRIFTYIFRTIVMVITFRAFYIFLREYFDLNGCVMCDEIKEQTTAYIHDNVDIQKIIDTFNNFHHLVDWIGKPQNIDMVGIDF